MKRSASAWSGIVYAVLFVVGIFLLLDAEPESKTDQEILAHYADSGNRATQIVGFFVVCAAVLCFLWFVSTLRGRLQSAEPESRALSTLGFGAGVAGAALLVGSAALLAGIAFAVEDTSRFVPDPDTARLVVMTGYLLLIGAAVVNGVVVATTSVLALRTGVLPNWVGWVGGAAIAVTIAEIATLPVFAIPIWATIVSIVMLTGRTESVGQPDPVNLTTPADVPLPTG